jgi:hypothetical protein
VNIELENVSIASIVNASVAINARVKHCEERIEVCRKLSLDTRIWENNLELIKQFKEALDNLKRVY